MQWFGYCEKIFLSAKGFHWSYETITLLHQSCTISTAILFGWNTFLIIRVSCTNYSMDCVQSRQRIVPPQKAAKFVVYETRFSIEYHLFLGLSVIGSVRCCTDEVRLSKVNFSHQ